MVRALTYEIKLQPATTMCNRYSKKLVLCFESSAKFCILSWLHHIPNINLLKVKEKKVFCLNCVLFRFITSPLDFIIIINIIYQNALCQIFATMTMKWRRIDKSKIIASTCQVKLIIIVRGVRQTPEHQNTQGLSCQSKDVLGLTLETMKPQHSSITSHPRNMKFWPLGCTTSPKTLKDNSIAIINLTIGKVTVWLWISNMGIQVKLVEDLAHKQLVFIDANFLQTIYQEYLHILS